MSIKQAYDDLAASLARWRVWTHLAWIDIQNRYRRTLLGPFWTVINAFALIGTLGVVFSFLWQQPVSEFLPYFSAGYMTWLYILVTVNESSNGLISRAQFIRSTNAPISMHIMRVSTRNLVIFLHMIPVHALILFFFGLPVGLTALAALVLGIILVTLLLFLVGLMLSVVTTRYRDIVQVVSNTMQVAFFVTPIHWSLDRLESHDLAYLLLGTLNPAYHLVDIIRAPLLGQLPHMSSYGFVLGAILFAGLGALAVVGRYKPRIAFWV